MKSIAIWGGTGLIGQKLVENLHHDYEVMIITRNPDKAKSIFSEKVLISKDLPYRRPEIIVNLAGENVGSKLWSQTQKEKIRYSRIITTRNIVNYVNSLESPPESLIQASAMGYYGINNTQLLNENSPEGKGFLADVTADWEAETEDLRNDVRKIIIRTGVVLSNRGGMLKKLLLPFRLFIGGHLGSGNQFVSWIHIEDEVNAIRFLIENKSSKGVFNLTSPNPLSFREFAVTLGNVLKRPSCIHIPSAAIKMIFGEMGKEILLGGQKAYPEKLMDSNFVFKYPNLDDALKNLLR